MAWKFAIEKTRAFLGGGINALLRVAHVHKPVTHPLHKLYHNARLGRDVREEIAALPEELRRGIDPMAPLASIDSLVRAILIDLSEEERTEVYDEFARIAPDPKEVETEWDTELFLMALNNRCLLPGEGDCVMGLDNSLAKQPHRYALMGREERENVRFGYINGIMRPFKEALSDAVRLSDEVLEGMKIHAVHNASNGGLLDLGQAFIHQNERCFKSSALLQQEWREYLSTHDGVYIQLCHSDGASCTYHALRDFDKAYRARIIVIAIAPAIFIPKGLCKVAYHIANEKDTVVQLSIQRGEADPETIFSIAGPTKGHVPHDPFDPQKVALLKRVLALAQHEISEAPHRDLGALPTR